MSPKPYTKDKARGTRESPSPPRCSWELHHCCPFNYYRWIQNWKMLLCSHDNKGMKWTCFRAHKTIPEQSGVLIPNDPVLKCDYTERLLQVQNKREKWSMLDYIQKSKAVLTFYKNIFSSFFKCVWVAACSLCNNAKTSLQKLLNMHIVNLLESPFQQ